MIEPGALSDFLFEERGVHQLVTGWLLNARELLPVRPNEVTTHHESITDVRARARARARVCVCACVRVCVCYRRAFANQWFRTRRSHLNPQHEQQHQSPCGHIMKEDGLKTPSK